MKTHRIIIPFFLLYVSATENTMRRRHMLESYRGGHVKLGHYLRKN